MAGIYFEGFNGTSTDDTVDTYMVRRGHNIGGDLSVTTGRLTGVAFEDWGFHTIYWGITVAAKASYIIGFAMKPSNWIMHSTDYIDFLYLLSDGSANEHIILRLVPNGEIGVWTNADYVTTSGLRGKNNAWMYVEFKFTIHDSAGSYELKVNGKEWLNRTNLDTYDAGTVGVDEFQFNYKGGAVAVLIDDLYICDTLGGVNDDFLGDCRIDSIDPDGAGATTDWTPSAGDNYAAVDDSDTPDDDTTYVETSTTTHEDLYTYGDLGALGTVHSVQMNVTCRETDTDDFDIEQLVRIGITTYDETPVAIAGETYEIKARVMDVDPATTAAWALAAINAAQFGFEATV